MDIQTIVNIISTVGFPIIMCLILFKQMEKNDDKREEDTKQMLEAINNNTRIMCVLAEKIGASVSHDITKING